MWAFQRNTSLLARRIVTRRRRRRSSTVVCPERTSMAVLAVTATGWFIVSNNIFKEEMDDNDDEKDVNSTCTAIISSSLRPQWHIPKVFPSLQHSSTDHTTATATATTTATTNHTTTTQCESAFARNISRLRRHRTIQKMEDTATKETLTSKYTVYWSKPLGEGTFGTVFIAKSKETGENVAVKKIKKRYTDNVAFQREMDALLHLRESGGHPNIAQLRENFDEGNFYYLVLDLVQGEEMFEHLCSCGAYSEADAARLVRESASALAFMHGIGIVHGDLKPENLMLSSENTADAVIKVVDFGTAQVIDKDSPFVTASTGSSDTRAINTPAYAPPEVLLGRKKSLEPSFDMWALGIIIYIMLTGVHPFDLYGTATDEEIEAAITSGKRPPLRNSPTTAHLSDDAISVIEKLIQWKPHKRLTADQLLEDPWVRGETARTSKIADSDKRLSAFRAFKTKISEKVFKDMLSWTSKAGANNETAKRTSLLERAFRNLDPDHLQNDQGQTLSLSDFSDLVSDNMRNKYFPKGHVICHEKEIAEAMYFINSGKVQVYTQDGFKKTLVPGDFFGEGALLRADKKRSASVRCLTPVHVIEIPREYFEKSIAADKELNLDLRAQDRQRRLQRADTMLLLAKNMEERKFDQDEILFREGEEGKELFIVEDGKVDISVEGHFVLTVNSGAMCGGHSLIMRRPRNVTATCTSKTCTTHVLRAADFYKAFDTRKSLRQSVREICLRREFQKAVCVATQRSFPRTEKELREAFDAIAVKPTVGVLELENLRSILLELDPNYSEKDIRDILDVLDLDESGTVKWEEFKRLFNMENA